MRDANPDLCRRCRRLSGAEDQGIDRPPLPQPHRRRDAERCSSQRPTTRSAHTGEEGSSGTELLEPGGE